jgi:hypothetical protein
MQTAIEAAMYELRAETQPRDLGAAVTTLFSEVRDARRASIERHLGLSDGRAAHGAKVSPAPPILPTMDLDPTRSEAFTPTSSTRIGHVESSSWHAARADQTRRHLLRRAVAAGVLAVVVGLTVHRVGRSDDASGRAPAATAPVDTATQHEPAETRRPMVDVVTVAVRGAPEGARIELDGVLLTGVPPSIQLAKDDRPRTLTVDADGYRRFITEVKPQTDIEIEASLEPTRLHAARRGAPRTVTSPPAHAAASATTPSAPTAAEARPKRALDTALPW